LSLWQLSQLYLLRRPHRLLLLRSGRLATVTEPLVVACPRFLCRRADPR
jgi:hypothetical protein